MANVAGTLGRADLGGVHASVGRRRARAGDLLLDDEAVSMSLPLDLELPNAPGYDLSLYCPASLACMIKMLINQDVLFRDNFRRWALGMATLPCPEQGSDAFSQMLKNVEDNRLKTREKMRLAGATQAEIEGFETGVVAWAKSRSPYSLRS